MLKSSINLKKIESRGSRDLRPISLPGGLYESLNRVLMKRLRVDAKMVSKSYTHWYRENKFLI